MKEYIVTLKNFDDLDNFYEDMETIGGNLYIPNRVVECINRREISRNTHYMLSEEEALQIRNDARVLSCELTTKELGLIVRPHWTQTSLNFDKSGTTRAWQTNWGLLRCVEGIQRNNWGDDGISNQSGSIQVNLEGKNVDIVIVDGHIDPNHPEMAKNSDGSGGTRVVQYNWLQHASPTGVYQYGPYTGPAVNNNNHGMHVAGIAAGNTQGWARSANIYNISPYIDDPNGVAVDLVFDYIRSWHNSKPINPQTGRRNPTICNNSWGFGTAILVSNLISINYRGTNYTNIDTNTMEENYGVINDGTYIYPPQRVSSIDADMQDAMNDGIILLGAAGNDRWKIDNINGVDYNNYFIAYNNGGWINAYYYHRGMTPASDPRVVCVGAIGRSVNDAKAWFSSCGPRIDIYAPGRSIISSTHNLGSADVRNTSYFLNKLSGTSMATPQVTGVLACLLEIYPEFNQEQALDYLIKTSKSDQIYDSNGGYSDLYSLQSSPNRYLYYYKERPDTGATWPKLNYKPRPTSGRMYPRQRVRR